MQDKGILPWRNSLSDKDGEECEVSSRGLVLQDKDNVPRHNPLLDKAAGAECELRQNPKQYLKRSGEPSLPT